MSNTFRSPLRIADIVEAVCEITGVHRRELLSVFRDHVLIEARHCVCVIARHEAGRSYPEIGRFLDRDHTTILYAVRTWSSKVARQPHLRTVQDRATALAWRKCEQRRVAMASLATQMQPASV